MIKNYTDIIDTNGQFAFFKLVGSSNNYTSLIWVSDDDLKPTHKDWVNLAQAIKDDTDTLYLALNSQWQTVPKIKGLLMQSHNLRRDKSCNRIPDSWNLMIRRSGVSGNSPRKWKGSVSYPQWFVDFLFNNGDIPSNQSICKPVLMKR